MISSQDIAVYLDWLRAQGQVWPSLVTQTKELAIGSVSALPSPQSLASPVIEIIEKQVIFVSCETLQAAVEDMRDKLLKALKLPAQAFHWLHTEPEQMTDLQAQLGQFQANILIAFGSNASQLIGQQPYGDDDLPISLKTPQGLVILLPSLASMLAEPNRKIAVWRLFQEILLK